MLRGKGRTATIMLLALAVIIGAGALFLTTTLSAQQSNSMMPPGGGTGWNCGGGWYGGSNIGWCNGLWGGRTGSRGSQFMARGKIVAVDTATITITMDGASPSLLTNLGLTPADLPKDVEFQMGTNVTVWGCGWHKSKWGSGSVNVAGLKAGESVNIMGYYNKTSGQPVATKINVWFF